MWKTINSSKGKGMGEGTAHPPSEDRAYDLVWDGEGFVPANVQRYDERLKRFVLCADQEAEIRAIEESMDRAARNARRGVMTLDEYIEKTRR